MRTKEEQLKILERVVAEAFNRTLPDGTPNPHLTAVVAAVKLAHEILRSDDEESPILGAELEALNEILQ